MKTFLIAALLCSPLAVHAQQSTVAPAAPTEFSFKSNPVVKQDGVTETYTVLSTQPPSSKLVGQKLQLRIEGASPSHTFIHTLNINTGKFRTVGAMEKYVADVFRRFLAGPVAAGQEFGQIGNVNLGGEIHFVAESADQLNYKIVTPGKEDNLGHFSREDAQVFLPILAGTNG